MVVNVRAVGHIDVVLALIGLHVVRLGDVRVDGDHLEALGLVRVAVREQVALGVLVAGGGVGVDDGHGVGHRRIAAQRVGRPHVMAELVGSGLRRGGHIVDLDVTGRVMVERVGLRLRHLLDGLAVLDPPGLDLVGGALRKRAADMQDVVDVLDGSGHGGRVAAAGGDAHDVEGFALDALRRLVDEAAVLLADVLGEVRGVLVVRDLQSVVVGTGFEVRQGERLGLDLLVHAAGLGGLPVDVRHGVRLAVHNLLVLGGVGAVPAPDGGLEPGASAVTPRDWVSSPSVSRCASAPQSLNQVWVRMSNVLTVLSE